MFESEINEVMESTESISATELQEQREQLCQQAEAAREAGNEEKANYFLGEVAKLDEQLAQLEDSEGVLGQGFASGHSERYWQDKMTTEYANYGKTPNYYIFKKNYEAAILNS